MPNYWLAELELFTKGEVDAPLTSVMGMKRRRLACCHLLQDAV
jgi:hypothetical protein